ncbi:MAG: Arc family DNA-binding protein [Telluria sp.]
MTKPPVKKIDQSGYIKTSMKLPPDLHAEVVRAAELHGHSMNSEIIARLQTRQFDDLRAELAEVRAMVRKVLDQM